MRPRRGGEREKRRGSCKRRSFPLLLVSVCGDGGGVVFDGAEPARGLVVAVRGSGHGSRADERSDHVGFTLFLVVGNSGRENEKAGACGCRDIRVAFQEAGKLDGGCDFHGPNSTGISVRWPCISNAISLH